MPVPQNVPRTFLSGSQQQPPYAYGYEPQRAPRQVAPVRELWNNLQATSKEFFDWLGNTLPAWWPRHPDGIPVTQAYHVVCHTSGSDLKFPAVSEAMSHSIWETKQGQLMDFSMTWVKHYVLKQIDKSSEGILAQRPFLSCSLDLEGAISFGNRKRESNI